MDVDEDDRGAQRVRRVPDFSIEVDFDALDESDRDVHPCPLLHCTTVPDITYLGQVG